MYIINTNFLYHLRLFMLLCCCKLQLVCYWTARKWVPLNDFIVFMSCLNRFYIQILKDETNLSFKIKKLAQMFVNKLRSVVFFVYFYTSSSWEQNKLYARFRIVLHLTCSIHASFVFVTDLLFRTVTHIPTAMTVISLYTRSTGTVVTKRTYACLFYKKKMTRNIVKNICYFFKFDMQVKNWTIYIYH